MKIQRLTAACCSLKVLLHICGKMETPFFLPQPTITKNSSRSVSDRRTFQCREPGDGKQMLNPGAPQTNKNRLKRTKTHKGLDHFTDCGNSLTPMTETPESNASCDVILIKRNLFADAAIPDVTDSKDHSVSLPIVPDLLTESTRKGHHSQTIQNVSPIQNELSTKRSLKRNKLTLKTKRMSSKVGVCFVSIPACSSDGSFKPDIDHFATDKEVLPRCLRINTSEDRLIDQPELHVGQIPESTKHHESGQTLTPITPRTQHICREATNVKILREMVSGWRNEFPDEISNAEKTDDSKHPSTFSVQRKRKREVQEQTYDRTYKSHRTNKGSISSAKLDFQQFSDSLTNSHTKCRNRLSRTKRRQQQTAFCAVVTEPMQNESVHQDPWPSCLQRQDALWTDKYNPQQSSEVIGNSASVRQLHSWLNEWKIRADIEERRRQQEERRMKKENSNESWDCGDFEGDTVSTHHEKELCNTVLMIGPSGVGKTAAVYACAQELGFKVFEVNSSVLRCGRLILSQLTEATQSHQVDIQRIKTLKPEIINQSKINPAPPCDEANRKVTSSKESSSSPSVSCLSGKPQPVKLTHFFKLSSKKSVGKTSDGPECCIHAVELKPGRLQSKRSGFKDKRQGDKELACTSKDSTSVWQSRSIPMSLILFEEVDVIFPKDVGFLAAIRTFMSKTKRPIILTTNDPFFGRRLKGHFDEIHFQSPSLQTIRSYLQCLCVVENTRTDPEDMAFLLCQNKGDIRRSILQLQLWACSGGGRTELQILKDTLKCRSWIELENSRCLEILAEKTGGGLLYSNIERLFSPDFTSQSSHQQESIKPKTKGEKPVKGLMLHTFANVHKVKSDSLSTCRGKKHLSSCEAKNISYPHSDCTLFSVPSKQTNHLSSETNGQDKSFMLFFQHLVCIAKFFDNMSFLDGYLQRPSLSGTGHCKPEPLGWMGATLNDSLLDLPREEHFGQCFDNSSEIMAIVEGLSFLLCRTELSGIWTEAARLRELLSSERWEKIICALSLPSDKKPLKLCLCKFCAPGGVQKRKEIVSILISSKKVFCHGNKPALSMDYLPTLRSICRSERVKEQHSVRHSHYLSSLQLPRSTLELMALDFP
ncbi:ATPase family AAA domain-containing protein 5b isoform X2 [Pimephales promelas]|uniref:ATPase family AAA domain-containing protein 5b isoform X2 n=1 Tax=Pimephales promelas TaxID=90988 RepID=UPI001955C38F|nr:ATPase family AAA domain-containing protein 5b isoform X2 [Pimephales promelas]